MTNVIARSYYGAMCLKALEADDVRLAREYYNKIAKQKILNARLIALGARISLLENDTKSAIPQLLKALDIAETKESQRARYIEFYCKYFLHLIERSGRHEEFRKNALALLPGDFYTDSLPLPQREISLEEVDAFNQQRKLSLPH